MAEQSTSQRQLTHLLQYEGAVLAVLAELPCADPTTDSVRVAVAHLQEIYDSEPNVTALLAGATAVQDAIDTFLATSDLDERLLAFADVIKALTSFAAWEGALCLPQIH